MLLLKAASRSLMKCCETVELQPEGSMEAAIHPPAGIGGTNGAF